MHYHSNWTTQLGHANCGVPPLKWSTNWDSLSRSGEPKMAGKRDNPEEIVMKLRQVEVL